MKFRRLYLSLGDCAARHTQISGTPTSNSQGRGSSSSEKNNGRNKKNNKNKNKSRSSPVKRTTTISFNDDNGNSKQGGETSLPNVDVSRIEESITESVSSSEEMLISSAFNPAHCHADLLNSAYVTKLIDRFYQRNETKDREDWISLLLLGHHYYKDNRIDPRYADNISHDGSVQWKRNLDNDIFKHFTSTPKVSSSSLLNNGKDKEEKDKIEKTELTSKQDRDERVARLAIYSDQWPVMAAWSALFKGRVFTRENFYSGNYFSTHALPFDSGGSDAEVDISLSSSLIETPLPSPSSLPNLQSNYYREEDNLPVNNTEDSKISSKIPSHDYTDFAFGPGEELSLVALSPSSMSSFWWPQKVIYCKLKYKHTHFLV